MKVVDRIKKTIVDSKDGFKNYPITIISLVLLFILSIVNIEVNSDKDTLSKILIILSLFIPISLVIRELAKKRFSSKDIREVLLYIVSLIVLYLYYRFILVKDLRLEYLRIIILNLAFYIMFSYVRKVEDRDFTDNIIKIITDIIISGIYSLVLYLGFVFILFTIDSLFNLDIYGNLYLYMFFFVGLIFFPLLLLSKVSREMDYEKYSYPKALKGLLLYIIIPLSIIYISILYVYFLKIIFTRTFPTGVVSNLVLWYSIIVMILLFFIKPLLSGSSFLEKYKKYMTIALLPILIMMFLSIGIRINQYGITESRYFVVIMGIWIIMMNLYLVFREDYRTRFIPISLSIILIVSVVGPFSAFSVSKRSQLRRLESILIDNKMLVDGKIIKNETISNEDKTNISGVLDYFLWKHSLEDIDILPEDFKIEDMKKEFGFEHMDYYENFGKFNNYVYMTLEDEYIINQGAYDSFAEFSKFTSQTMEQGDLQINYDWNTGSLIILKANKSIYENDIAKVSLDLYEKLEDRESLYGLDVEDMTYVDENDDIRIKILFDNIDLNIESKSLEAVGFKLFFNLK